MHLCLFLSLSVSFLSDSQRSEMDLFYYLNFNRLDKSVQPSITLRSLVGSLSFKLVHWNKIKSLICASWHFTVTWCAAEASSRFSPGLSVCYLKSSDCIQTLSHPQHMRSHWCNTYNITGVSCTIAPFLCLLKPLFISYKWKLDVCFHFFVGPMSSDIMMRTLW